MCFTSINKDILMKLRKIITLSLLSVLFMNFQCEGDDTVSLPCGLEVISDNTAYESA